MTRESVVHQIRRAATYGSFHGQERHPLQAAYLRRCTHLHAHTGTLLIYTRDAGHHTSGWMANPQFERCLHLSISFRAAQPDHAVDRLMSPHVLAELGATLALAPFDHRLAGVWAEQILHPFAALAWTEPAMSHWGRQAEVRHWRIFCDEGWHPNRPVGEVYSRRLTEAGWKTWSELQGEPPNWIDAT